MTQLKEINEIMEIAYKLDNLRCHLFEHLDNIEDNTEYKRQEDYLMSLQEQIQKLINKSWDLYNNYYGNFKEISIK